MKKMLVLLLALQSVNAFAADAVQIKRLAVGQDTMEVLDPNPKGLGSSQPGSLVLVKCMPKLDVSAANVEKAKSLIEGDAYPIVLTAGSQLVLRRDTSYRFADGSTAAGASPIVLLTCD